MKEQKFIKSQRTRTFGRHRNKYQRKTKIFPQQKYRATSDLSHLITPKVSGQWKVVTILYSFNAILIRLHPTMQSMHVYLSIRQRFWISTFSTTIPHFMVFLCALCRRFSPLNFWRIIFSDICISFRRHH